ncbi:MAG: hypothetical protein J6B85_06600 [Lachnospiraceae bacterium]|nr:hypothetical protein [Lachnospiraceae bacterium]
MKDWKKIGKRLLFPPVWLMIILAVISTATLVAVFMKGLDTSPIAYAIYVLAFYTLTVICIACALVLPGYYRGIKQKIYDNEFGNKYMTDAAYRTHFNLYISFGINLLYVAVNLFTGIWFWSVWSITLAAYYIILAVMRFLMLRFVGRVGIGKDREKELKQSRLCGIILMTVNLALSGVVVLVIVQNKGFEYHGILIYVMAMYTFYVTVNSIINLFKYRKYNSPVMSTTKSINLAAALVSMLSLETAMLSQFGGENATPHFDQIMVGATGAGVCAIVLTMSIYTIVHTNKELKNFEH